MNNVTLNQALDTVMQLPFDQQEMLIDIVLKRHIESRRREIAADAHNSLVAYRAGQFEPQSASEIIAELHDALNESPDG